MICLPKEFAEKFTQALKSGKIDPEKLSGMTSQERRDYFGKIVGEADAREVNAMFESKTLLKNQKTAYVTWAKQVSGISPKVRSDIVSKIEKMQKVLDPAEEKVFLEDLAAKKLGIDVSFEEAKKVAELSKTVSEAKAKLKPNEPDGSPNALEYGAARVVLIDEINRLKLSGPKTTLKDKFEQVKNAPLRSIRETIASIAGAAKGIRSSLDNSLWMRQMFKTMFTNPVIWSKNFAKSWSDIATTLAHNDDRIMGAVKADVWSRKNSRNGVYKYLDVRGGEEAFPSNPAEKIPLIGRFFKASQVAYEAGALRMRADIADRYADIWEANGLDPTVDKEAYSLGTLVNSMTGRGQLGPLEKVGKEINAVFFSPKFVKSQFDFLTAHVGNDKMSLFAKKQAAKNLLKVTAGMAVILGTARALYPDSVEPDSSSSDFGKLRIGDTRIDISGGMGSMVVLSTRLITQTSKSSTTGKKTPLNSGKFGSPTDFSVLLDFATNKAAPIPSALIEFMKGQTFAGEKPTFLGEAVTQFTPMPIANVQEMLADPNSVNLFVGILLDSLGASTNTYGTKNKKP